MYSGNINNLISNGKEFTNILLSTAQSLTEEQKMQVLSNLGIELKDISDTIEFTETDIESGILNVTHQRKSKEVSVIVYNNNNDEIIPVNTKIISDSQVEITLGDVEILDTWRVVVMGGTAIIVGSGIGGGESAFTNFTTEYNQDGTQKVKLLPLDPDKLYPDNVPSDFQHYTVTGESAYEGNFYLTLGTSKQEPSYLMIVNEEGKLLFYKRTDSQCYHFRKAVNSKGQTRYTYLEVVVGYPKIAGASYQNCEFVVLDENFVEMDRVRMIPDEEFKTYVPAGFDDPRAYLGYPCDSHGCIYLDDYHYMLFAYFGTNNGARHENYIQEQKYGKIIWAWDTKSLATDIPATGTDPYHMNDIYLDEDMNVYISFAYKGLVKINRDKTTAWYIGRTKSGVSLDNVTIEDESSETGYTTRETVDNDETAPYTQHCVKIIPYDNSILTYDNMGNSPGDQRVGRYWIDEETSTYRYKEYIMDGVPSKSVWGGALLIDDANSILDVSLSNGNAVNSAFREYDYINQKVLMDFKFTGSAKNIYQIWRDFEFHRIPKKRMVSTNKTELNTTLETAKALVQSEYTSESWTASQISINIGGAEYFSMNINSTQTEIDTANTKLVTSISLLVRG